MLIRGYLFLVAAFMAFPFAAKAAAVCKTPQKAGGILTGVSDECMGCGQCQIADIFVVGNTIIKLILGLSGSVLLLMVVYAGFILLTSAGNAGMVDKAKKILSGSLIGIIIVFTAYTATQFLVAALVCNDPVKCKTVDSIFSRPFERTNTTK
jgi:hypothetical protein